MVFIEDAFSDFVWGLEVSVSGSVDVFVLMVETSVF